MLTEKLRKALNHHLNREMYSAYLYLAMSSHADQLGLKGFATWYMVQYHEEMFHVMKLLEYIQSRGEKPSFMAVEQPPADYGSPLSMFEQTLEHEQAVTGWVNELMELAIAEKDHATRIFLQWFVSEQVEEEQTDGDIIAQLKLIKDNPEGLLIMDKDLGARAVAVPTDYSRGIDAAMKGGM